MHHLKFNSLKKGFTIVEIVVVIGLIAIVMGVASTSFSTPSKEVELKKEAEAVVDYLTQTKNLAIAQRVEDANCQKLKSYYIKTSSTSIERGLKCETPTTTNITTYPLGNYTLNLNKIKITSTNIEITFNTRTGKPSNDYSIKVQHLSVLKCAEIKSNASTGYNPVLAFIAC